MTKSLDPNLPTIGILIFEGFLTNEVVAPLDVFTKKDANGKTLFNTVLLAKEVKTYVSEEGLRVLPDFTLADAPDLSVLVVPSSMNPNQQTGDTDLTNFIKNQEKTSDYIASHCAGAFLLGEAGVADGKNIVTYCGGSADLQQDYPKLLVLDDATTAVVQDGKIISSNGNLVSYLASLELLEKMTSAAQRRRVEEELLLNKLQQPHSSN